MPVSLTRYTARYGTARPCYNCTRESTRSRSPDVKRFLLSVLSALALVLPACSVVGEDDSGETFNPGISSLNVPSQVSAQEDLQVDVSLLFGSQNCTAFGSINVNKDEGRAVIEAAAKRYPDRVCLDVPLSVDTTLTLSPPYENPFTVVGDQPGSEDLTRTVTVQ